MLTLGACRGEVYAARQLMALEQYPICNWVWAQAYKRALDYDFGLAPRFTTPDEMHDWMKAQPEWKMVFEAGPRKRNKKPIARRPEVGRGGR